MWANFSHKGHCNGPSHNRQDKNRVELGPRFPTSLCRPGKKHQHKEAAVLCTAQDASPTQTDLILFIMIIYLHYCSHLRISIGHKTPRVPHI